MPKGGRRKRQLSVTIDSQLFEELNQHCEENSTNRSKLIEKLLKKFLDGVK